MHVAVHRPHERDCLDVYVWRYRAAEVTYVEPSGKKNDVVLEYLTLTPEGERWHAIPPYGEGLPLLRIPGIDMVKMDRPGGETPEAEHLIEYVKDRFTTEPFCRWVVT